MLPLRTKVDNKLILALQVALGVYLALIFILHGLLFELINFRFGFNVTNQYPVVTLIAIYILTAPLAIIASNLVSGKKLPYDTALQAGLIANYTFVLVFAVLMLLGKGASVFGFIGVLFFASIVGFALAAISAVLYEKIILIKLRL